MTVTEFALLHLRQPLNPSSSSRIIPTLASAMRLQDKWHQAHYPHLPSSAADRAAVWFTQVEDPSCLLTTARWESVAAHWEWINSAENKGVMAQLQDGDIIPEDTVLLHVVGGIFGFSSLESKPESTPLLESPVISIGRMFVERGKKEAFAAKFEEVRGILEEYARPHTVRYGWREDVEDGADEEFVLVCGWESVEKHFALAETPRFARYGEIRKFVGLVDLKHYKPLSLE